MIRRVEGLIERVAVTGAFVVIEGWHIPTVEILGILKPHFSQEPEPKRPDGPPTREELFHIG